MDRMLYISMSSAQQIVRAQTANNNNLANLNTTGFRGDYERFRSIPVYGDGYASRVYTASERIATNFEQGTIQSTGRPLDVSIQGPGFIAVLGKEGQERYTRAGDFHVNPTGQLLTGTGLAVMGEGGPLIIPPAEQLEIGVDGTISIRPLGGDSDELAVVGRIKLVNPDTAALIKGTDGLIHGANGAVFPADLQVRLASGTLETSNVNAVGALVNMISLQRDYELQVKMMTTAEETGTASAKLLSLT